MNAPKKMTERLAVEVLAIDAVVRRMSRTPARALARMPVDELDEVARHCRRANELVREFGAKLWDEVSARARGYVDRMHDEEGAKLLRWKVGNLTRRAGGVDVDVEMNLN
jgi:hypothetical protein